MACNIVVSTGAGISAESGIHTYRDADGLWTKHDPMEVSHIQGWIKNPQKVLDFKNAQRRLSTEGEYRPNAAHLALTRLQAEWRWGDVMIVTQNIDGLHAAAGSRVLAIHGSIAEKFCTACGHVSPFDADIVLTDPCRSCGKPATTRPHVVMFGEMPFHLDQVEGALRRCGIFAAIGTSDEVAPANQFVQRVRSSETYRINLASLTAGGGWYRHQRIGRATVEVPRWVDELLALRDEPVIPENRGIG